MALIGVAMAAITAHAQLTERAGRIIGGQSGSLGNVEINQKLSEGLDYSETHSAFTELDAVAQQAVLSEIERLQEFVAAYQPRHEVITVTVYRNSGGDRRGDGRGGDDGGDDGGGDGGDGGGGGGACD